MNVRLKFFLFEILKITSCLCVVLSAHCFIYAADAGENSVIEKETEAREASKIWNGDSYRRSISLYEKSAEEWRSIGRFQKASYCLRESAKLSRILSDYKGSLESLKKALKFDAQANDIDGKIISLSLISLVSRQNGETERSKNFYQQAVSLNKFSRDNSALAYSYVSAGMYNFYNGDIPTSIGYFEKAYTYAAQTQDINLIAESLLYSGYSKSRETDPTPAFEKMKAALEICRENDNNRCLTLSYFGIGYLHSLLDEKQTALDYFKKAEELFPSDFEWLERAKLYSNISTIYEELSEPELSETYGRKAFTFFENANYAYGQLATLPNLARLEYLKGNKEEGLKLFTKALDLATKQNDEFYQAYVKQGIGDLNLAFENYDSAVENYRQALKTYKHLNIKLPNIKLSLGKAYEKKGEILLAEKFYNESLTENSNVKSYQSVSQCLFSLSRLSDFQGDSAKSLSQVTESLKITDSLYSDVVNNKLKSSFFSSVYDRYELLISLMMKMHKQSSEENYSVQALQAAEKSRARSMMEKLILSEANFNLDADTETVKNEKKIRSLMNAKADKLTDLLSQNGASDETEKLSKEINELENQLEEIKANLKQNSPIYSAIKNPAPFDVGEFQRKILDENSLLLEFSFGKDESYLWLIGKNEFASYVLPPREQIENKIQKLRELLASRELGRDETIENFQARIARIEKEYSALSGELSRDLFGQVAEKFGDKKLIIVPDGKLGIFPVAALPFPNSDKNEPILLSNEVVYEPSASTLSLLAKFGQQLKAPTKSLLIFSDPVFSLDDNRLPGKIQDDKPIENENTEKAESFRFVESLNSLERLKSSKTEAESIVNILGNSGVESLSGFAANRERLLNENVGDYKILHFATHGIIDENRPELSGIVLSRFDENSLKTDEFFRLHDIYGMNLNSDLVVLSACYTGVGKEVKGEGLMSLNNAFLSVGAKSVLSSLWKVEDGATLELMKNFYEAMTNERLTPSKALQKAQIKMLKSERYKSPFYWAAFTVQGDFKNVPRISASFSAWKYFLPMTAILLFGTFWGLRVIRRRNRM